MTTKLTLLAAAIAVTLATITQPSAAMVLYPWCANYGGGRGGGNC